MGTSQVRSKTPGKANNRVAVNNLDQVVRTTLTDYLLILLRSLPGYSTKLFGAVTHSYCKYSESVFK